MAVGAELCWARVWVAHICLSCGSGGRSLERRARQRIDMDVRTIEHWKPAVVARKRQKQIGPTQDDDLRLLPATQVFPDTEQESALLFSCVAGSSHGQIFLMGRSEALPFWQDNLHTGQTAIEAGGHDRAGPQQADPPVLMLEEFRLQGRNRTDDLMIGCGYFATT